MVRTSQCDGRPSAPMFDDGGAVDPLARFQPGALVSVVGVGGPMCVVGYFTRPSFVGGEELVRVGRGAVSPVTGRTFFDFLDVPLVLVKPFPIGRALLQSVRDTAVEQILRGPAEAKQTPDEKPDLRPFPRSAEAPAKPRRKPAKPRS